MAMEKFKQIKSPCGKQIIEVMQDCDGTYILRKFIRKYDPDEEESYEIREYPDPVGRFGDFDSAVEEAKRLLKL